MTESLRTLASLILVVGSLSLPLGAQQFVSRQLPGPIVWSEGAAALDFDEDGDLDLLIVNANGWSYPGDITPSEEPLPPTLLRNDGTDIDGFPIWSDISASHLPAGMTLHGKGLVVFDADDDGHVDVALAAGFWDQQRLLRMDPGGGTFLDETSTRLPTLVLNALSVAAGDVDDDGDLDLVYPDAGPTTFGDPGGLARLLLNDGSGVFTDASSQLGAIPKVGAQNAKFVDIDGDCDLDVIVDGKSPITQLYLNDGSGQFSLEIDTLPGSNQAGNISTYETDYADLDGDGDFDALIMNVGYEFVDAVSANRIAETNQLRFDPPLLSAMDANNCHDENDFAFLDADDDGDLDVIVGALHFSAQAHGITSSEKLYLNTGPIATDSLSWVSGAFDVAPDATLDIVIADFDGNGVYDIVTVQGEYQPFRNMYHRNGGPADSHPPAVLALSNTPATLPLSTLGDGWPRRAVLQDHFMDDGGTFLAADLVVSTDKGGETTFTTTPMKHVGGSVFRGVVDPTPSSTGLVGMDVTWSVDAVDPGGNATLSVSQTTRLCGAEAYGAPSPDPSLMLAATGEPTEGSSFQLDVSGGAASAGGLLLVGLARASLPKKGGVLLVDPGTLFLLNLQLGPAGALSIPVPVAAGQGWEGLTLTTQLAVFDGAQPQGVAFSNGLELVICGAP